MTPLCNVPSKLTTMGLLEDFLLLPLKTKTALRGEADVVVALVVVVFVVDRIGCYEFSSTF